MNKPGIIFETILAQRLSRREFSKDLLIAGLIPGLSHLACASTPTQPKAKGDSLIRRNGFKSVPPGVDDQLHVPKGYEAQVLLRWGDPLFSDTPDFNPESQTAPAQLKQFGNNCDFVGYMPLPRGSQSSDHGLLCVNHEFNWASMMFPGYENQSSVKNDISEEHSRIEMAALGHSVVEIKKSGSEWKIVQGEYNRRISLLETPMEFSGPVQGSPRIATNEFGDKKSTRGTMSNCSGGVTPWGTVLLCEENFADYFEGTPKPGREFQNYERYGIYKSARVGHLKFDARFDLEKEPNGANHYGWVVEYDPYDKACVPKKRTALGRVAREAATVVVSAKGEVVVYSGDDDYFEYLYKFVSSRKYDAKTRTANLDILDEGVLYAARFDADGSLEWLPLVYGEGKLTKENGFFNQADVSIEARRAADLVGATPMDRPEDVETNPVSGDVYVMLTKNKKRKSNQTDAANPFENSQYGHVLKMIPPKSTDGKVDHSATRYDWDIFLAGGPVGAQQKIGPYHEDTLAGDALACPDNCTFDKEGRLWIATDGSQRSLNSTDGVYACGTTEEEYGLVKRFLRVPSGAEACGPCFTPDGKTLFVAIQHPGFGKGCTYTNPASRWPDFDEKTPPRPSVIAVVQKDGKPVGS